MASPQGRDGSISVNQDLNLYTGVFDADEQAQVPAVRYGWLHVVRGEAEVNGQRLSAGDAAAFKPDELIEVMGTKTSEILLFDLV